RLCRIIPPGSRGWRTRQPSQDGQMATLKGPHFHTNGDTDLVRERLPASPEDRVQLLERLLGEPACRSLGIYPIPATLKLSVVIPVYNEKRWLRELVRRVEDV